MLLPYDPDLTDLAKELRKRQTYSEDIFWQKIRNRKFLGYKFLRQKPILTYIADFYCYQLSLIIELDGGIHQEKTEYDNDRTNTLKTLNVHVARYTNDQILNNLPRVLNHLERVIRHLKMRPNRSQTLQKSSPSLKENTRVRLIIPQPSLFLRDFVSIL
jgi:very-short-patch-repair endonuclease